MKKTKIECSWSVKVWTVMMGFLLFAGGSIFMGGCVFHDEDFKSTPNFANRLGGLMVLMGLFGGIPIALAFQKAEKDSEEEEEDQLNG